MGEEREVTMRKSGNDYAAVTSPAAKHDNNADGQHKH